MPISRVGSSPTLPAEELIGTCFESKVRKLSKNQGNGRIAGCRQTTQSEFLLCYCVTLSRSLCHPEQQFPPIQTVGSRARRVYYKGNESARAQAGIEWVPGVPSPTWSFLTTTAPPCPYSPPGKCWSQQSCSLCNPGPVCLRRPGPFQGQSEAPTP